MNQACLPFISFCPPSGELKIIIPKAGGTAGGSTTHGDWLPPDIFSDPHPPAGMLTLTHGLLRQEN